MHQHETYVYQLDISSPPNHLYTTATAYDANFQVQANGYYHLHARGEIVTVY